MLRHPECVRVLCISASSFALRNTIAGRGIEDHKCEHPLHQSVATEVRKGKQFADAFGRYCRKMKPKSQGSEEEKQSDPAGVSIGELIGLVTGVHLSFLSSTPKLYHYLRCDLQGRAEL